MNLTMGIHLKYAAQLSSKWGPPLGKESFVDAGLRDSMHATSSGRGPWRRPEAGDVCPDVRKRG